MNISSLIHVLTVMVIIIVCDEEELVEEVDDLVEELIWEKC